MLRTTLQNESAQG